MNKRTKMVFTTNHHNQAQNQTGLDNLSGLLVSLQETSHRKHTPSDEDARVMAATRERDDQFYFAMTIFEVRLFPPSMLKEN